MTRADLDKQPGDVAAMFDGVAERYDLMNDILSAGQVRLWRRAGRARLAGRPRRGGRLAMAAGDALRLPFRDGAFDAVTISFGLRNVASPGAGLAEMRRVTRPGGRLVVCEFSAITIAPADMLYRRYLLHILPAIARRTARSPEAYEYLAESIVDWPAQRELAGLIETAGWSAVRWRNLSLGAVAVHVARRT